MIWSDEFEKDGKPDESKWTYDVGGDGWGNQELQYYTDRKENVCIENQILKIRAVKEEYGINNYTSARITTKNLGDFRYGRVRIRAKLEGCTARGTWPAIWMLPSQNFYGGWPKSGEIDIMEHVGYDVGNVHGAIHSQSYNHLKNTQKTGTISIDVTNWHVYEVIWTEEKIQFLADNSVYYEFRKENGICCQGVTSDEWPFDHDFHLILNVAVGGSWGGREGIDEKEFDGDGQVMSIDWVRIYEI